MDIYREHILDHYKHPRNQGPLASVDKTGTAINTTCGDKLTLELQMDGETVRDVAFHGQGCAISQASASLLTDEMKGRSLKDVQALTKANVEELLEGPVHPGREKCATLILKAVEKAVPSTTGDPETSSG